MRSYTQQHLFRGVARGTDKLLGDLRNQESRVRFFAPVEILIALGVTNPVNLPLSIVSGCQQVGNSIAQVHALAGFWVVVTCSDLAGIGLIQDFQQVISIFRANRLGADAHLQIHADRCVVGFSDGTFDSPAPSSHEGFSAGSQLLHADDKITRGGIIFVEPLLQIEVSPTVPWTIRSPASTASSDLLGPGGPDCVHDPYEDRSDSSAADEEVDHPRKRNHCLPPLIDVRVLSDLSPSVEIQVRPDLTGQQFNDAWALLSLINLQMGTGLWFCMNRTPCHVTQLAFSSETPQEQPGFAAASGMKASASLFSEHGQITILPCARFTMASTC